jgi:hypothetical protein
MSTANDATFDATVRLRCWGTDDPRVIPPLSYENQPSATQRRGVVCRRAAAAGWPVEQNAQTARDWRQRRRAARQEAADA